MDWWQHLIVHALIMYATVGTYLGIRWARDDGSGFWEVVGWTLAAIVLWPAAIERSDGEYFSPRRETRSKAARAELARMARVERNERTAVEILEASGRHRQAMAELHERRVRAEEL